MKLNNKGYLIVEVILAGVLTFTMAYFLINLTLKIRNRYDDVNVETVMLNDKTVITNEIMGDVVNNEITNVEYITNGIKINFEDGSSKELTIVNNVVTYGTYTKKFSENAIVGNVSIRRNGNYFLIEIPVTTKYSDKDYGINIVGFTKEALEPLTCNLTASSSKITASFDGNMIYYGWDENYKGSNSSDMDIAKGTYTYYMKDAFGNTGSCSINIAKTSPSCSSGYTYSGGKCSRTYTPTAHYKASGDCYCRNLSYGADPAGTCTIRNNAPVCSCPSGTEALASANYCEKVFDYYSCGSGTLSGGVCYAYGTVSQVCPNGYKKVSGSDYCYKS